MNMKSLSEIKKELDFDQFDLEHEANMVQSRILSPIIELIESKKLSQVELQKLTGLKQPFISALLNIRKKLSMEHIARFQHALDIKLESPTLLSSQNHDQEYYIEKSDYNIEKTLFKRKTIRNAPSATLNLQKSFDLDGTRYHYVQ